MLPRHRSRGLFMHTSTTTLRGPVVHFTVRTLIPGRQARKPTEMPLGPRRADRVRKGRKNLTATGAIPSVRVYRQALARHNSPPRKNAEAERKLSNPPTAREHDPGTASRSYGPEQKSVWQNVAN